jgi:hypothetical protein
MTSAKYIGLDVHKESISIAVLDFAGKVVMECVIETKASTILQFIHGMRGDLQVTLLSTTTELVVLNLIPQHDPQSDPEFASHGHAAERQ